MTMLSTALLAAGLLTQAPQEFVLLTKRHLPAGLPFSERGQLAVADLDRDGAPDLVIGGRVHRNLGGRFQGARALIAPPANPVSANAVADVNGDGLLDLVVAAAPGLRAYVDDGRGNYVAGPESAAVYVWRIVTGDIDGDGDIDLLVEDQRDLVIYRNDGVGGFGVGTALPPAFQVRRVVGELLDVDGDGDLDVMAVGTSPSDAFAALYRNDGAGNFTRDAAATPAGRVFDLRLADLDADGDQDAVVLRGSGGPIGGSLNYDVWRNDGTGMFQSLGSRGLQRTTETWGYEVADGNADGFLDVISFERDRTLLMAGNAALNFRADPQSHIPARDVYAAWTGDLDGDGDVDILAGPGSFLLLHIDRGRFASATDYGLPTAQPSVRGTLVGHLDDDGLPEVVLIGNAGLQMFRSSKDGWVLDPSVPMLRAQTAGIVFQDLDGDGDDDLFLGVGQVWPGRPQRDRLYRNDGGRLTIVTTALPDEVDVTQAAFAADFDGDGAIDILKYRSDSTYRVLLQQEDGRFVARGSVGSSVPPRAVGDFDGDGDIDLVTSETILLNDGRGSFTSAGEGWPSFPPEVRAAAARDFDGDGDVDLFVATFPPRGTGVQDRLYENVGGALIDVTLQKLPIDADMSRGVVVADVDGDGDLDLLVARHRDTKFLRNEGGLRFVQRPLGVPASGDFLAVADLDGDEDLDVLRGSVPLYNTETQIAAPFLPIGGMNWRLTTWCGAAFGDARVLLALGVPGRPRRWPGVEGQLRIDPAFVATLGVLDMEAGRESPTNLDIPLPRSTALLGVEFVVQGLFVGASGRLRFSNAVYGEML